ncbi:hypothetical protein Dimus_002394 [Dionaea muscipula]
MMADGGVKSGLLDNGWIKISTKVEAPLNCVFKLMVDGKEFVCRMVEDCSVTMEMMQQERHCSSLFLGQGLHREDHRILGSLQPDVGTSIVAPEEEHKTPSSGVLSSSADGDVVVDGLSM